MIITTLAGKLVLKSGYRFNSARIRIIEPGYLGQVNIPSGGRGLVMYLKPDSRPQNLSTWTRAAGVITCDE